jgi:hypothetical protein
MTFVDIEREREREKGENEEDDELLHLLIDDHYRANRSNVAKNE